MKIISNTLIKIIAIIFSVGFNIPSNRYCETLLTVPGIHGEINDPPKDQECTF